MEEFQTYLIEFWCIFSEMAKEVAFAGHVLR